MILFYYQGMAQTVLKNVVACPHCNGCLLLTPIDANQLVQPGAAALPPLGSPTQLGQLLDAWPSVPAHVAGMIPHALDEGGDALVARSRSRTPTSQRSPSPTPSRVEWMATLIEAGASDVREGIIRAP